MPRSSPASNLPVTLLGLPRICSLSELSLQTGMPARQLWFLLFRNRNCYRIFRVRKKTRGYRILSDPSEALKYIQRWILKRILDRLVTERCSYGFERGSSIADNAKQHTGASALLCLDIDNFFPAIRIDRVTGIFRQAGYPSNAASMLARLCTCDGRLPQGAPSSPKLANLVCRRMDRRLATLAKRNGLVYSRYADDMTFSGATASTLARIQPLLTHIVRDSGFQLNARKTRLVGPARALKVTGLVLASGKAGIGRRALRQHRARLHHLHTGKAGTNLDSVQGVLDYVSGVDKARYQMLALYVDELLKKAPGSSLAELRIRRPSAEQ